MDAIRALVAQHRVIEGLFDHAVSERRRRARSRSISRLAEELIAHLAAEQAILYPSIPHAVADQAGGAALDAVDDPLLLLPMELRRMLEAGLRDPAFSDRITVLRARFVEHVREQEGEMFPGIVRDMSEATREVLGEELLASRPLLWMVTQEGGALAQSGDDWSGRRRVSLLLR